MFEVLFQYGSVTLKTFNVILAITFLLTGAFAIRFSDRQNLNLSFLSKNFVYLILFALLSGRVFYVIEHWPAFRSSLLYIFYFWDMHFSFFGILYGFVGGLLLLTHKAKEDFWSWYDVSVFSMLFSLIFINIGHFFNGSHYGIPTDLPWGISFDTQNIPFVNPIHPTQLYAAILALLIFLYSMKRSKRVHLSGVVGNTAIMAFSIGMIALDFLHGAPSLYTKVSFGIIATLAFIFHVICSHKSHNLPKDE
ncbi:prolipoprotein diacylglyceryl transferase [Candidatus Peregrinibacteria bacterium]|nr:prolipoprotein diacylglyceryl transferase [Candidatus Peregrinibacteria bacterium]